MLFESWVHKLSGSFAAAVQTSRCLPINQRANELACMWPCILYLAEISIDPVI